MSLEELRDEVNNLDWQLKANCIGVDSLLFIPSDSRGRDVSKNYDKAKEYCFNCDVRAECLAYAIYNKMEGLWGGFTPQQRKGLHKTVPVKDYFRKKDFRNGKKV